MCEWKGRADCFDVVASGWISLRAAWRYQAPTEGFAAIVGFVASYAGPTDHCAVAGEVVRPQPGGFNGGWITSDIVGPFKGEPGSLGWWPMVNRIEKRDLPVETGTTCNGPSMRRKQWAAVWDEVKYRLIPAAFNSWALLAARPGEIT